MANSPITAGQLELLADMVAERLARQPRCVDKHELAQKLGVSTSTVERLMAEKKVPVLRLKRRVLFDIEAVLAALAANSDG